jgi:hypothetical protein
VSKAKKITISIDYIDLIQQTDELFAEDHIDRLFAEYAERGIDAVQWRVSVIGKLLYHTKLGERFTDNPLEPDQPHGATEFCRSTYEKTKKILTLMDPMEVGVRLAKKHGIKFYPWLTLYDEDGIHPVQTSDFAKDNPCFSWKKFKSNEHYFGVLSYAYREVREYRIAQIKELLSYGGDGLYLCTRSHSRPPEYRKAYLEFMKDHTFPEFSGTPIQKSLSRLDNEARGNFGFDPPAVKAYLEKTGKDAEPNDNDWWKFRGSYIVDFLAEVKNLVKENGGDLAFGPHAAFGVYPDNFFQWQRLLKEEIIDEVHFGATDDICGKEQAENLYPWLFNTPGRKYYFHTVKEARSLTDHIKGFDTTCNAEFLHQFDGLTLFEAYIFIKKPELWDFVDYLKRI